MELLDIILISSLISLLIITLFDIKHINRQMIVFLSIINIVIIIQLIKKSSKNTIDINAINSINNKIMNNNSILFNSQEMDMTNIHISTNLNSKVFDNPHNSNNTNNDIIDNENVSISNDDNVTNIYTVDNKIYNQWKKNDKKQISNFGDLVNPNNNTNCITDKSCY
tara:strand:- start:1084 stop:1584 length:501 start_codon:yes stop_codon:yes gene_type:complete